MRIHRGIRAGGLAWVVGALATLGAGAVTMAPELITRVPGNDGADGASYEGAVTPNGRYVTFHSYATNLVNGEADTNDGPDVFVRDRKSGTTERVSVASDGTEANEVSLYPVISANGRFVLFESLASNLDADDTNASWDVFLHDRKTDVTRRVSLAEDGTEGNGSSFLYGASLSSNGRYATFYSSATTFHPSATSGQYQVFRVDLKTGALALVSTDAGGVQGDDYSGDPSISPNGRFVAFYSRATNIVAGDGNAAADVFVFDRKTGSMRRASVASDGTPSDGNSYDPAVSNNGNVVAFYSDATNLVASDTNGGYDVFLHDFRSGQTLRLSQTAAGVQVPAGAYECAISQSGKTVVFYTESDGIVPEDDNGTADVFAYDVPTGSIRLLSADAQGNPGDGYSYLYAGSLSFNGKWCVFTTEATNLSNQDRNGSVGDAYLTTAK
jgi:Tol biopolymer transport system component